MPYMDKIYDADNDVNYDLGDPDIIARKANIDGYYTELTAGNAEQLLASQTVEDKEVYNFRPSAGSADIGNREYLDGIVGGSLVWNQLFNPNRTTYTVSGVTLTNNENGSFTLDGTAEELINAQLDKSGITFDVGHVYYLTINPKTYPESSGYLNVSGLAITGSRTGGFWKNPEYTSALHLRIAVASGTEFDNNVIYPQIFDLTAMFGPDIADYILSLETTTEGAGVAWFRRYFPADYYDYFAPDFKHVTGLSAHETTGFNAYNSTTGTAKLLGGYQYQITGTYTALSLDGETVTPNSSGIFTPAQNGTLTVTGGGNDTCVHLVHSGYRNGEYEPYTKHSYPLDSTKTFRGIPMIDSAGNLYFDGDLYTPDGVVTRKWGIVDLGTLSWVYSSASAWKCFAVSLPDKAKGLYNVFCEKYQKGLVQNTDTDNVISGNTANSNIQIRDNVYEGDATEFKSAMSGVYCLYELDTPTTEQADPYQQMQIVDDFGTEEFVSTSIVPVGHITHYPANLRDKLQHLPSLSSEGDGTYLIEQDGNQMELTPYTPPTGLPTAPTTDGTYTLKCTVADGTASYAWEVME